MATQLVVKIKLGEETRRVTLDKIPTYSDLLSLIQQLFPSLSAPFQIKYQDEDEDLITLSTDKELLDAVNLYSKSQVLRLSIHTRNEVPSQAGPANSGAAPVPPPQQAPQTPFNPLLASLFNPQLVSQFANYQNPNANTSGQPDIGSMFRAFTNPQTQNSNSQSSTQTPSSNVPDFSSLFGSSNSNVNNQSPFGNMFQQFLNNPQMIQGLLTSFLPMIIGHLQNTSAEQRQKAVQFISSTLASNPQLAALAPQILANNSQLLHAFPELASIVGDINTNQAQQPQQTPNPFASFAQAFASSTSQSQSQSSSFDSGFNVNNPVASFVCNVCENPITGVRYHCDTCGDFDLCSFCQTIPQLHDASHKLSELHPQH